MFLSLKVAHSEESNFLRCGCHFPRGGRHQKTESSGALGHPHCNRDLDVFPGMPHKLPPVSMIAPEHLLPASKKRPGFSAQILAKNLVVPPGPQQWATTPGGPVFGPPFQPRKRAAILGLCQGQQDIPQMDRMQKNNLGRPDRVSTALQEKRGSEQRPSLGYLTLVESAVLKELYRKALPAL